jgi:nucleotide-binding universal stress UspA family protein
MAIQKILFPTRFRELAYNSLESLFVLKNAGLKEIVLCHVISRDEVGFVPYGGYLKEEEEKLREQARIRFEDWQKSLSGQGINSKIKIVVGAPVDQILHIADEEKVDLIVVGRKKRTEIGELFAGSNTLRVITHSKVPTLVNKYLVQYELEGEILTRINDHIFEMPMLIADETEQSQRALELLISLKGTIRRAMVFHNIDIEITHEKEELHEIKKKYISKLEDYCTKLKKIGIEAEPHLGAGDMLHEILRISREQGATMIIIGTTDTDHLPEFLHKDAPHQIVRESELPTLVVP